jgi:putative endonuclease
MISYKNAKARHIKLGMRGEAIAVEYLSAEKIEIICRNYKNKHGEVDIIARDGEVICFVEVKTRRSTTRSRPAEGLSEKQKKRITRSAGAYFHEIGDPKVVYRFDLIEIVLGALDVKELRYWRRHWRGDV